MEIERKYLIDTLPDLSRFDAVHLTQAYIAREPVLRIRQENDRFVFTCKGKGLLEREELNLPISKETFQTLLKKCDGAVIEKTRYLIPLDQGLTCELDVFSGHLSGLVLAEVEFSSVEASLAFVPPAFFGREVTLDPKYQNSNLSLLSADDF